MNGDDEVKPGHDRPETRNKNPRSHFEYVRVSVSAAVGSVKGPACIDPSMDNCVQHHQPAGHKQIPAQEIQFWKRNIPCSNHHWNQEIAQHIWDGGNQEEPNHDHAMKSK